MVAFSVRFKAGLFWVNEWFIHNIIQIVLSGYDPGLKALRGMTAIPKQGKWR
jgi:hypothetical protein